MLNIIIIVAVVLGGAISYSAGDTLPGDALYPVKINVNERLESLAAIGSEAESELQAKLALRRLVEAERLEAEGRLDAETKAELENEFKMHAQAAESEASNAESEGNSDAATSVRASLKSSIQTRGNILGIIGAGSSWDSGTSLAGSEYADKMDTDLEIEEKGEMWIINDVAELKLVYKDGALKLSGTLQRSNPCVDWKVDTVMTKDLPSSNVTFNIKKTSTAEVCIQVLGEPQKIEISVPNVSSTANVKVTLEGKVVLEKKMN